MKAGNEKPINRTAALVVSRGEQFEYRTGECHADSSVPLPVRKAKRSELCSPQFSDLTGAKVGRLTVIGLSADKAARWVCKCQCGIYVMRTSRALKNSESVPACESCKMLARSKREEFIRRTGRDIGYEEFMQ